MAKSKKEEIAKNIIEELNKQYGKNSIILGNNIDRDYESITTGSLVLDAITDAGGIPKGKLVEIYGPESSGKTTICLHIIAEYQKAGVKCAFFDYEYAFDERYAKKIGINVNELYIAQPDTMEDGYQMIEKLLLAGEVGLILIDSHTSMVSIKSLNGEIGDDKFAPEARINSQALKRLKSLLAKKQATMIGISQLRAAMSGPTGQMSNKPTGGNAWRFYSDMRIKIWRTIDKDKGTDKVNVTIEKNKCGKPWGNGEIIIEWGKGIDKIAEVINLAANLKIVNKSGSWYSYKENKIGQGIASVKELMIDNPELFKEIKDKVLTQYKGDDIVFEESQEEKEATLVETLANQLDEA